MTTPEPEEFDLNSFIRELAGADAAADTVPEAPRERLEEAKVSWVYWPGLHRDVVRDLPVVRQLCVDYLDPATLCNCWQTSKRFCLDPFFDGEPVNLFVVRQDIWRRYLRAWVPTLCAGKKWVSRMAKFRIGDLVKPIFIDVLRRHIFRAGLQLIPWQQNENHLVCAAGSYPLHEWLTRYPDFQQLGATTPQVAWTPGDVDIYFVHHHDVNDDDSDDEDDDDDEHPAQESAVRHAYNEMIRVWCEASERDVLKEDRLSDDRSLRELALKYEMYPGMRPPRDARLPAMEERDFNHRDHRRPRLDFDIRTIRNFAVTNTKIIPGDAMILETTQSNDQHVLINYETIKLPTFSFLRWRDHRQKMPSLNRVLESFDIDVCQVGIEAASSSSENDYDVPRDPYTITHDNVQLRPLNSRVATAILHGTATILLPAHLTSQNRIQKYQSRGFRFDIGQRRS